MVMYLRKANERGKVNLGWLISRHSFSFGHFYDANHMGFSVLRVINDDVVQPARGFDTHGHRDMEIISYVISGALEHRDSAGNHHIIPSGDVQVMSAGTGITHSEYNASKNSPVRFLQIWILPSQKGLSPSYAQKTVENKQGLEPLVNRNGSQGALAINQDASISRLQLSEGERFRFDTSDTAGYLHIIEGAAAVRVGDSSEYGVEIEEGDAVGTEDGDHVSVVAKRPLVALWFTLPH